MTARKDGIFLTNNKNKNYEKRKHVHCTAFRNNN